MANKSTLTATTRTHTRADRRDASTSHQHLFEDSFSRRENNLGTSTRSDNLVSMKNYCSERIAVVKTGPVDVRAYRRGVVSFPLYHVRLPVHLVARLCLAACPSCRTFASLPGCLFARLSRYPSVLSYVCLAIYPSRRTSVSPPVRLFARMFRHLPVSSARLSPYLVVSSHIRLAKNMYYHTSVSLPVRLIAHLSRYMSASLHVCLVTCPLRYRLVFLANQPSNDRLSVCLASCPLPAGRLSHRRGGMKASHRFLT